MKEQNNLCVWERAVPELISVNQDEQELRSIVWKRTTCPGSVPWLTATHTRGNSCSGTTSISNTRSGFGKGKSKCCEREREREIKASQCHMPSFVLFSLYLIQLLVCKYCFCVCLTFISMNLSMGSYHCSKTIPDSKAPQRYLWPVYGFRTERKRKWADQTQSECVWVCVSTGVCD